MGEEVRERVKERYAGAALTVLEGTGSASCCGSAGEQGLDSEAIEVDWTRSGYSAEELQTLPQAAGGITGVRQPHRPRNPLPWRGILLPRTPVSKGKGKDRSHIGPRP